MQANEPNANIQIKSSISIVSVLLRSDETSVQQVR